MYTTKLHNLCGYVVRVLSIVSLQSAARTDFQEFAGQAHLITAAKGWKEVAEYVANWLEQLD